MLSILKHVPPSLVGVNLSSQTVGVRVVKTENRDWSIVAHEN